jgi:RNA polymerase sigma-70 factor (ECF subfamily)
MTAHLPPLQAAVRPNDEDDADLIAAVVAGDERKFAEIYRRHVAWVYARLTRLVGPVAERDDLMQEIFLDLHRALPRFRGEARLSTFLHRIVINVGYEFLARVSRRPPAVFTPEQLDDLIEPGASPESRASQRQNLARAFAVLGTLHLKKRVAFTLVVLEGLSLGEAASITGASEQAMKQRVLHARAELLEKLERQERKDAAP